MDCSHTAAIERYEIKPPFSSAQPNFISQNPILTMTAKKRALLLIVFLLSTPLFLIVILALMKVTHVQRTASSSTAAMTVTILLSFFSYFWLRRKLGANPAQALLPRYGWAIAGWTVIAVLLSLFPYLLTIGWEKIHWENLRFGLLTAAIVYALTPAFVEEVLFRDMLLRWMLERYTVATSIVVQIIFFSALHFVSAPFSWNAILSYSIGAILCSLLWLLTEDFVAPMAGHFVWDFTVRLFDGIYTPQVVRAGLLHGETPPSLVYGHLALEVLAILVVWWAWRRKRAATLIQLP